MVLIGLVRSPNAFPPIPECNQAFMKLDKDKDGFLSSLEARPMLRKAVGDRLTDAQIGGLWKMADIDGDSRLNRQEVIYELLNVLAQVLRFDMRNSLASSAVSLLLHPLS